MIRYLILIIFTIALTVLALSSPKLINQVLERDTPEIEIISNPKGLGVLKSKIKVIINDHGAGLDAAVVRVYQRNKSIVIFKQDYRKEKQIEIEFDLPDKSAGLEEGLITLEIRAFDKSFWNNVAEKRLELFVDFNQPEIELITTQHNVRKGGAQLAIYQANDKNLAIHGVKVGKQNFLGFPIRNIAPEILEENIYAVIFSLTSNHNEQNPITLFAEDAVGNSIITKLPVKILKAHQRQISRLINSISLNAINPNPEIARSNLKDFIEEITESELKNIVKTNTLIFSPRVWTSNFMKFPGQPSVVHGDELQYQDSQQIIATKMADYYEVDLSGYNYKVPALQAGIVNAVGNNAEFGNYLFVNHGIGIFSFYANLSNITVKLNDQIEQGDTLGELGNQAGINVRLVKPRNLFYQLYIQEQSSDAREWWEASWYNDHIEAKINELKIDLGIITVKGNL